MSSEKLITDINSPQAQREEGSSRGSSPDMARPILEHSMESLIISDSSEEGTPTGLELELESADQLEVDIGEEESKASEGAQGGVKTKGKKRRISSRRARKISLTSSDRVVCNKAGVQVTT